MYLLPPPPQALRHVFSAPFVPVTLWTSFIGDVLTSLVKPLIDLVYSACYILTLEFAYPDPQQGRYAPKAPLLASAPPKDPFAWVSFPSLLPLVLVGTAPFFF